MPTIKDRIREGWNDLLEKYPEWVAFIKYFEGIATKDIAMERHSPKGER